MACQQHKLCHYAEACPCIYAPNSYFNMVAPWPMQCCVSCPCVLPLTICLPARLSACLLCVFSPESAKRVQSQLCAVIRPMYSSPPIHGAAIVVTVLSGELHGCQRAWLILYGPNPAGRGV